jgi:TatD DNase family protein
VGTVPFADSHTHLADPAFEGDREAVIDRARGAGARILIAIGESPDAADRARDVARSYPGFIWHTCGRHPHDASAFDPAVDPDRIREHVTSGAVAIGECGLDYHYDNAPRDVQRRVLDAQLQLAHELDRPVVIHTREAVADTTAMVRAAGDAGVQGVLHCFGGPRELADAALDAGWYVSFSGIVTFRKWSDDDLVRAIPDDRLLIESDAPYLAPVPFRGKRNEPAHVVLTAARVALARGIPPAELGQLVVRNTIRIFRLAMADSPA